jgi:ornithine cyclodeaminase/alanine dehydrogenase
MLLLRHEEVAGLLSPAETIAAVRRVLVEQGEGQVQVPPRITIDATSGHGWLRVMPTILNGSGVMGYKAMHSTPKVGVRYLVALYDLRSGELLAQMDADWLTVRRTAATVAVATDVLARPGPLRMGLLGSSDQARAMLTAIAEVRPLSEVTVFSPTEANRRRFADTMGPELGLMVRAVDSPDEALAGRDLIMVAIRAGTTPVLRADWIVPGAHVNGISAVRPEAREIEDGVWRKADRVVVDDRAHVFESGDGRSGIASGSVTPEGAAELWEVLSERRPGRQGPEDVTLFKAVGTAAQDLALAAAVYERARERGIGTDLGEFPHVKPF